MQYKKTLFAGAMLASTVLAAAVPVEPWTTLTPSGSYSGGISQYATSFGVAVVRLSSATSSLKKREGAVSQIGDGQVQAAKSTVAAVSQIGDGQVQAAKSTVAAVSQIGDGQVQAAKSTVAAVSQIGDGQVQAAKSTAAAASQIGDGQVQAAKSTAAAASQIGDGQVQATKSAATSNSQQKSPEDPVSAVSCKSSSTLSMSLNKGVLTDAKGRIGSIVANRQFQFDGPPPQAGAIYAAGWSITPAGNLAIGSNDVFYQCLSGDFYNLYDQHIGSECYPVHLEAIDLVDC